MIATTKFNTRDWPGSLCRLCGYYVPDVVSERHEIPCEGCGKALGNRAFDRFWGDLEEGKVQEVLQAEAVRAAQAKLELDRLVARSKLEKNPALLDALLKEIDRRTTESLHVPRDFKLPASWQKRHESLRKGHFCGECHLKRRASGTDFSEETTHVTHEIHCSICGNLTGWLYLGEHHRPEEQEDKLKNSGMDCTGRCSATAAQIDSEVRKTLQSNNV